MVVSTLQIVEEGRMKRHEKEYALMEMRLHNEELNVKKLIKLEEQKVNVQMSLGGDHYSRMNSNSTEKMKILLTIASNIIQLALQIRNDIQNSERIQKQFKKRKLDLSEIRQLSNMKSDDMETVLHAITTELESGIVKADLSASQWEGRIQGQWITNYAKRGWIENARKLFDQMPERDVITWTTMVSGYSQNGRVDDPRNLFDKMPQWNVISWTAMLSGYKGGIEIARKLFDEMPKRDIISWTSIVVGYAQNGRIDDARKLFDKMPMRNVVSCNAMIAGYAQHGKVDVGRQLFDKMPERNLESWNAMIAGYIQNNKLYDARHLFDIMPGQNVVSWTAMITGYAQSEERGEALKIFSEKQRSGTKPSRVTFVNILSVCASLAALEQGKQLQGYATQMGLQRDVLGSHGPSLTVH
ncbi:pentatricopeptide repeat-containing protein At2g35030, mitochondrial-like [Cryptomeria japonica]|uniref:pentatricopeptide repeat-containing protein At2g35030, mitochondrial-like n=1 Tax=Cryptomeria japonica TaxID=3369 RepID=UPI0027DA0879|nr:pentatricopeptide repeat-containing protein At2g35030, mitochondrial-like [Cryptomeria japonica]